MPSSRASIATRARKLLRLGKCLYAALKSGDLTFEELQEIAMHYAVYVGWLLGARLDEQLLAALREVRAEAT